MADIDEKTPGAGFKTVESSRTSTQLDTPPARKSLEDKDASNEVLPPTLNNEIPLDQYPTGFSLILLVGSVMLTVFLIALDQTIVGTAIPKITDEFHGLDDVSWYGAAYFMCLGGFQSMWGKAYRYFSLKPTFLLTIFLFELGSFLCGIAPNSKALIIGRAISGVGGAGIATGGTVIIAFCAEPKKRPTLMGLLGLTYAFAAVAGPLLGGVFADRVTWRWAFYINLPIGGVAAAVILFFFNLPAAAKVIKASWKEKLLQMDPVGIALAMGCIISFILAFQYGGITHPWHSSTVIGLFVGFFLLLIALAGWEVYQGEYAMLVPRLLKLRSLWAPSIFQFCFAGSYFLILYYLPIYFQAIRGRTPIGSGVDNLPMVGAVGFFVLAGGITVSVTGHAAPFMAIGAALTTVSLGLFYSLGIDTASAKWIGYQILAGAALAFPFQNCLNIAHANVGAEDISSVTSILYFFQTLGGAFGVSAAQSAFVNRIISTLATKAPGVNPMLVVGTGAAELRSVFSPEQLPGIILAYMQGIKATFAVATGMAGFSFLMSFVLPWKKLHGGPPGEVVAV